MHQQSDIQLRMLLLNVLDSLKYAFRNDENMVTIIIKYASSLKNIYVRINNIAIYLFFLIFLSYFFISFIIIDIDVFNKKIYVWISLDVCYVVYIHMFVL